MNWVKDFCPKEFDDFIDLSYLKEFLEKWIKEGEKEGVWKHFTIMF